MRALKVKKNAFGAKSVIPWNFKGKRIQIPTNLSKSGVRYYFKKSKLPLRNP